MTRLVIAISVVSNPMRSRNAATMKAHWLPPLRDPCRERGERMVHTARSFLFGFLRITWSLRHVIHSYPRAPAVEPLNPWADWDTGSQGCLRSGTDPNSRCRPMSSGAVQCGPVSLRREQDVSKSSAEHDDVLSGRQLRGMTRPPANLRVVPARSEDLGCETAGATWVDEEPLRSLCSAASATGHDGESFFGAWVCTD
jgi:hypothetical protein